MKRTKQELLQSFSDIIGENTTDLTISFLEDISDSVDIEPLEDDYKTKYEEAVEKYRKRFLEPSEANETPTEVTEEEDELEVLEYDDLFKEGE